MSSLRSNLVGFSTLNRNMTEIRKWFALNIKIMTGLVPGEYWSLGFDIKGIYWLVIRSISSGLIYSIILSSYILKLYLEFPKINVLIFIGHVPLMVMIFHLTMGKPIESLVRACSLKHGAVGSKSSGTWKILQKIWVAGSMITKEISHGKNHWETQNIPPKAIISSEANRPSNQRHFQEYSNMVKYLFMWFHENFSKKLERNKQITKKTRNSFQNYSIKKKKINEET